MLAVIARASSLPLNIILFIVCEYWVVIRDLGRNEAETQDSPYTSGFVSLSFSRPTSRSCSA